jgi:hypothetical protein
MKIGNHAIMQPQVHDKFILWEFRILGCHNNGAAQQTEGRYEYFHKRFVLLKV